MADLHRLTVVYYHSVGPVKADWEKSFLTVGTELFEQHLDWLRRHYNTITLKDYWKIRHGLIPPVKNPLVITFDDGYLDNWLFAFPLLKKYGMKATIFVSPEFVDEEAGLRSGPVGRATAGHDEGTRPEWGFLSWEEMQVMESSRFIDIQSHALTHTKYFVSDKLTGFHHPGGNILYPVLNRYPAIKPGYIGMEAIGTMLPYGFPLFEEQPALIARRVVISPEFVNECVDLFRHFDFSSYEPAAAFSRVKPLYESYLKTDRLIAGRETDREYEMRVNREIVLSKKIIGEKLGRETEFLCWPHGANNESLHRKALEAGYLMTTTGKARGVRRDDVTRIPDRAVVDISGFGRRLRTIFRMKAFSGQMPYYGILNLSRRLRNI